MVSSITVRQVNVIKFLVISSVGMFQILVHQTQLNQKAQPLVTNMDLNTDSAHLKGRIDEMNRIKSKFCMAYLIYCMLFE